MENDYSKMLDNLSDPKFNEKVSIPKVVEVLRDQLTDVSKGNRSLHLSRLNMRLHFDLFELFNENNAEAQKLKEKITQRKPLRLVRVITPKEDEMAASYRLTHLQREADFIEKETGNYDLYIGYPFVEGEFGDGTHFKCPLMLFPVILQKDYKKLEFVAKPDPDRNPMLNKTFIIAYQKFNRVQFNPEYDFEIEEEKGGYLESGMRKCEDLGMKFDSKISLHGGIDQYETKKGKMGSGKILFRSYAILGLFPQTSSTLLADYDELIKKPPQDGALYDFFNGEAPDRSEWLKPEEHEGKAYFVTDVDGSQEKALLSLEKLKGIAIHGPPGTGKSQLIVNIIADGVAKGRKVLLVCEKRAALDVVHNRLSAIGLGDMVALVHDYNKDRSAIFAKASKVVDDFNSAQTLPEVTADDKGGKAEELLNQILSYHKFMTKQLPCGSNLKSLYVADSQPLLRLESTLGLEKAFNFSDFNDSIEKLSELLPMLRKSPNGEFKTIDASSVASISDEIAREVELKIRELYRIEESLQVLFNSNEWRYLDLNQKELTYPASKNLEKGLRQIPAHSKSFLKFANNEYRKSMHFLEQLKKTAGEMKLPQEFVLAELSGEKLKMKTKTFASLELLFEYNRLMDLLLTQATELEKQLGIEVKEEIVDSAAGGGEIAKEALDQIQSTIKNKEKSKILSSQLDDLNANEKKLLKLLMQTLEREKNLKNAIEIVKHSFYTKWITDAEIDMPLLKKLDRITYQRYRVEARNLLEKRKIKARQEVKRAWHQKLSEQRYSNLKEIKFQCEKTKNPWSIRKLMREFSDKGGLDIFPCWLCSPETVSAIFPLTKGLFDVVVFDEASQCTLEHAIPAIYRGKAIAVAGDEKQLPPFDLFTSHLDSEEMEEDDSKSVSELREVSSVKSFLQLSKRRYPELLLNWHYRSKREELIGFSNFAFYNGKIQTVAGSDMDKREPAIEYIKVDGVWDKRKNKAEAERIVELITKTISKPNPPSIGVVTFNSSQRDLIENLLEKKALADSKFYVNYKREKERVENEEFQSLFVKNIENVQGDERDMIIFSVGYAPSIEDGKVLTQFGSLSMAGGENRLNVAVTRAREKVFVIASIDPMQLRITEESNIGGQFLRKYLEYAKAVSDGNIDDVNSILRNLTGAKFEKALILEDATDGIVAQLADSLTRHGYLIQKSVGYSNYSIDLAIIDKSNKNHYSLGIEIDKHNYNGLIDAKERDIYRQSLLESRGWKMYRIGSRDWWSDSEEIVREIKQELKKSL